VSVHIRFSGSPEEVAEAVRQVEGLPGMVGRSPRKPSRTHEGDVVVYLELDVIDRSGS
jgi:hypothetical protein